MFPAWRFQLREARLAMADGRWDEAAEMLASDKLREFLPAKRLSQELAGELVTRARQRIENGNSQAGWKDLDRAARLGAGEMAVSDVRQDETRRRLQKAQNLLAQGDAAAARQALERMEHRRLGGTDRRTWQMIAQHLEHSDLRARRGDVASAIESLEHAQRLLPADAPANVRQGLQDRSTKLHDAAASIHRLDSELHAALAASNWTEVLKAAESLLELAPQHSAARQARHRAWQVVGMEVTLPYKPNGQAAKWPWQRAPAANRWAESTRQLARNGKVDTVINERTPGKRIVAWIDEVGAYMICMGDEVVLGQPAAEGGVDVPILADLSRRHAIVRREREAYVLTPLHKTAIDGRVVTEPTVLRDKSAITLGNGVELRFRKPHALSATAVLEIVSRHRTEPAVDGIVLMSESCILGPQSHSHIRCRDWTGDLVLFRRNDELMCRTQKQVEIEGQTCTGQAAVSGNCRIEGEEFALSLEEL
jgi:hypothetical protein